MTSSGRRIAFFVGLAIAFMLPKKVPCGRPDTLCAIRCTPYEVEPIGFYLIEYLVDRNVGFVYSRGTDC